MTALDDRVHTGTGTGTGTGDTITARLDDIESMLDAHPRAAFEAIASFDFETARSIDPAISGRAHYLHARLAGIRGDYAASLHLIRSARLDYVTAGRHLDALRTALGLAHTHFELGEYRQAAQTSDDLLAELNQLPAALADSPLGLTTRARAHGNRGNALSKLGDHAAAATDFDIAVNLFDGLGESDNRAEMIGNKGAAYLSMGMLHVALTHLERAEQELRSLNLVQSTAKAQVRVADALTQLGRAAEAIGLLEEAKEVFREINAHPDLARTQVELARALLEAGFPVDARAQASDATSTLTGLAMVAEAGRAMLVCGLASIQTGMLSIAEEDLQVAERLLAASGDAAGRAQVWLAQARVHTLTGAPTPARELATQAHAAFSDLHLRTFEARALLMLADLVDDVDAAERHLDQARQLISTMDIEDLRLEREIVAARLLRRRGRLDDAASCLRTAVAAHWQRLSSREQAPFDLRISAGVQAANDLVDILLELDTSSARTEAWQVASVSKAFMLNHFADKTTRHHVPNSEAQEVALLELSDLYDQLSSMSESPDRAEILAQVRDLERWVNRDDFVRRSVPRPSSAPQSPRLPTLSALQFHVLGDDLVIFVLRDGGLTVRRLQGAAPLISELTDRWRAHCSRIAAMPAESRPQVDSGAPLEEAERLLNEMHSVLIEPVEDQLVDLEGEPLLLIGHLDLFDVPFEALIRDDVPLGSRFELHFTQGLSRTPSQEPADPATDGALVLAVPNGHAPALRREALHVATHYPDAEVRIGDGATTATLAQRAPGRDLIHLAGHGEFATENPLFSRVRLADRWLTALEITRHDLTGSLVVVSGCNSGRSSEQHNEPAGLPWALIAAGARAVVACKWAVDDQATADFMGHFYDALAQGATPRAALSTARRAVAQEHPHPYYWAAFRYICSPATALIEGVPA